MADRKNKALPAGTVLRGTVYTYTIEKVLGQGSFGITYLASTLIKGPLGELSMPVAVKEFFAKDLDSRSGDGAVTARTEDGVAYRYAKAFQRESQNLSRMKHPGIVKVLEAFQTNGTYYYSMEYLPGGSLDDKVRGEGIPEEEALPMIAKIGEALAFMHGRKMMHLDLKPKNIMLKADGTPVIIDFGLSKQYDDQGEPESSTSIGLGTPGYAPIEQATQTTSGGFQPTLDIYALGATLFKMLTGKTPPTATLVLNKKATLAPDLQAKNVSPGTVDAIRKAMTPLMDDRPQRVEDFLSLLGGKRTEPEDKTEDKTEPKPAPGPAPTPPGRKPKTWLWALLGGLAVLAAYLGFNGNGFGGEGVKLPIGSAYVRAGEDSFLECTSIADAESKMIDYFFRDGEESDIHSFDYEVFRKAVHAFPEEAMAYGFDKLRELAYIDIFDSEDGAVRAYSWDDLTGGTMISFDGFYQYRWKGKVRFDEFDQGEDDFRMSTRKLHSLGDGHYLRHAYLREWSSMAYEAYEAFRLTKNGLVMEDLFDDGINGPSEDLGTEYNIPDWYFRAGKGEGYPWLFYFDAKEKTLYYPLTDDSCQLSDRYVPYKWDGKKMVSTPEVGNPFLHSSLREYESLVLLSRTSRDRVRIDRMNDGSYRYAAWTVSRPMSDQPDIVLLNGAGSADDDNWVFRNKDYEYQVTESTLTVLKNGNPFAQWDFE